MVASSPTFINRPGKQNSDLKDEKDSKGVQILSLRSYLPHGATHLGWVSENHHILTHRSRPLWKINHAFLATFCRGLETQGLIGEGTYRFLSNFSIEVQHSWVPKTIPVPVRNLSKTPSRGGFCERFLHEKPHPTATCEWEFQLLKSWCSNQPQKPIHER